MSAFSPFDPTDEERANNDVSKNRQEIDRLKQTLNSDVAKRVGEIYARKPYMPPSVILAMAKQGVQDATVDAVDKAGFTTTLKQLDPDKPKKQSWMDRNVYGKFKAATRWTFAGLQLAPDLVQNFAADAFSPNDPAGTDGWFRSTSLGTMLAAAQGATMDVKQPDGTTKKVKVDAGTGFFLGETGLENQAAKAREYRGTINGHAWTVGRGAAQVAFTPGSIPYNVLSGFLDAAVQFVDPTIVGGKALAGVRAGRAAIPLVAGAEELPVLAKMAQRSAAGLDDAEQAIFEASKFGKWVTTDKRAQRLTGRIVDIAKGAGTTLETKVRQILEEFNYTISPDIARSFAEADEASKVHGILGEASARLTQNPDDVLIPRDIREVRGARISVDWMDKTSDKLPFFRDIRNSRWFATVPKNSIIINGTGLDQAQSIKNYENYLVGVGIKKGSAEFNSVMDRIVFGFTEPSKAAGRVTLKDAHDEVMRLVWRQAGGRDGQIGPVLEAMREEIRKSRVFNIDDLGKADDGGFVQRLREVVPPEVFDRIPPDSWDKLALIGPGALAQLADDMLILPDFRSMRRLAGSARLVTTVKGGARATEERLPFILAEWAQNEIWKPLTLMTGGYILRNMIDAQTRIAMTGTSGLFNHPRDFILWVLHKKGFEDIRGERFENVLKQSVDEWDGEVSKLQEALTFDARRSLDDPIQARSRLLDNGNFAVVESTNPRAHTLGYVDNLGQLFGDEINRQLSRLQAMGLPEGERVRLVKEWLMSDAGAEARAKATRYLNLGVRVADPDNPANWHIIAVDTVDDDILAAWVDRLSTFKTGTILRGDTDLAIVSGYNKVPLLQTVDGRTTVVPRFNRAVDDLDLTDPITLEARTVDDIKAGSLVTVDGKQGLVLSRSGDEVTVQFVYDGDAFTPDRLGSTRLRELIDIKRSENKLARSVTKAERGDIENKSLMQKVSDGKDFFVDGFFRKLYGRGTQILEKSPLFRQAYYREVGDLIEGLSPSEAKTLLDRVLKSSELEGIPAARYVGDKKVLARLEKQAASTSTAIGTIDELDIYAKSVALNFVKRTLYNATERNNLEDTLRVVIPFGSAWKEVLGTYARAVIQDPTRIRRGQLIFDGARKFDPDGDGNGFFYRDATTGEYSFNFPLSGDLAKLVTGSGLNPIERFQTGLEAPLQAPVKRVSIGLGIIPALGPMGQIAYSKLAPDTPNLDFISKVLLPYGEKKGLELTPRWLSRLGEAFEANTINLQTVYGNTYVETLRALSASGEYDLSDPAEQERIYADARTKARALTAMRALGQFFGPAAPTPEFKIDTIAGDFYGTQLVKEFQKLQAENYDTAVQRFLETYGNDAILYISNKTESVAGGLEATDEFGDWERSVGDKLISRYPNVAGFMAPGGSDFSFEVWSRQMEKGKRRRLSDREMIALAQYRAASAQYRTLREKLPPNPTQEQTAWLRQWRIALNKEYPGFPAVAQFNPGEFPAKIAEMKRMVADPDLADNDVADALRQYLDARDKAVGRYVEAGGAESGFASALAAAPLRDWLANYGRTLKQEVPEFARIYDRILSNEVDA